MRLRELPEFLELLEFLKRKPKRFLSIDFGQAFVKVLYVEAAGQSFKVLAYDVKKIASNDEKNRALIVDFINNLLQISSLDEIQLIMKNTRYYKAIREGLLYFKNYNEVFVFEAFLDQLYYLNLIREEKTFSRKEQPLINLSEFQKGLNHT